MSDKYRFKVFAYLYMLLIFFCPIQRLFAQWETTSSVKGNIVSQIVSHNHVLYALTDSGISSSRDLGGSWIQQSWGFSPSSFNFISDELVASTQEGIYRSLDFGGNWDLVNSQYLGMYQLASNSSFLFASGYGYAIYRSPDKGMTWSDTKSNLPSYIRATIATDSIVFVGTSGYVWDSPTGRVYSSTNNGGTWNESYAGGPVNSLTICEQYLYAGLAIYFSTTNLSRTSDNGLHWAHLYSDKAISSVTSLCPIGANVFIGTSITGVYRISNDDSVMSSVSSGLSNTANYVQCMTMLDGYLFIGTKGNGVWRRQLSEITAITKSSAINNPKHFSLLQNYPNPFNPSTAIRYSIAKNGHITLTIFNILGDEVASLVSKELPEGTYESIWDASGFGTGIYFYRLQSDSFCETKKLLLLR